VIRKTLFASLLAATAVAAAPVAQAGPYSDDLGKCLVAATSSQDKAALVQWIYFSLSLNPQISPFATITAAQREATDKELAKLFERLVTESCASQTKQAIQYEGTEALSESFKLLGQVAAQEIFKHPAVAAGTSKFTEYLDEKKLGEAFGMQSGAK